VDQIRYFLTFAQWLSAMRAGEGGDIVRLASKTIAHDLDGAAQTAGDRQAGKIRVAGEAIEILSPSDMEGMFAPFELDGEALELGVEAAGRTASSSQTFGSAADDGRGGRVTPESLMARVRMGDREAYANILRYSERWLRKYYADRLPGKIIEEVVRESMIIIHVKRCTYRVECAFDDWILAIAKYKCVERTEQLMRQAKGQWRSASSVKVRKRQRPIDFLFPSPKPHHSDYMFV
jgi:hypothetical protein